MMTQEVALKETGNSKLIRPLANNQSFECADVKVGDWALHHDTVSWKSAPKWRGLAAILDIDQSGATVRFRK